MRGLSTSKSSNVLFLNSFFVVVFSFALACHSLQQGQVPIIHNGNQVHEARQEDLYPPLVLLGGIAQTKSSWDHHLVSLTKHRKVLVYEVPGEGENTIEDYESTDVSLPSQARRLLETLDEKFGSIRGDDEDSSPVIVDIAGFSFGGRLAMAAACLQQQDVSSKKLSTRVRIRGLHLTGVGCDRSDFGHLAMQSFVDVIHSDPSLKCFAWSILLATYSPGFLRGLPDSKLQRIRNHIASTNHPKALLARLEQAEVSDTTDPWHVVNMAKRLANGTLGESSYKRSDHVVGKLCVGELDGMAPIEEVERLRIKLGWMQEEVHILQNCGHAVVIENPRGWRESVLCFFNELHNNDINEDNCSRL